ncbi:hypothetical protein [Ruegeria atlantica]|uniref:hypothetical protein n=1 Tax=Ruegeria atlantica TaxID=81569 RepID=UPI00147DBEC7|nr:hypothetical protein [Ruegeria atlantica]
MSKNRTILQNVLIAATSMVLAGTTLDAQEADPNALKASDTFDKAMLDIYYRGREALTDETRPIMIIARDVTVVTEHGQKVYPRVGPAYDQFKSVAHVLLGIIGSVTPWPEGDAGKIRWMSDFSKIQTEIESFLTAIDGIGLSPEELADQVAMLEKANAFVTEALSKETLTPQMVADAINDIRPYWSKNMTRAAQVELNALHNAVTAARAGIDAADWDQTYIITHGPNFVGNTGVVLQYLQRVMPEKFDSRQVLFAENISGLDHLVKYVGHMRMQWQVGAWAFGDPMRMDVDLLGYEVGSLLDGMIMVDPPSHVPQ